MRNSREQPRGSPATESLPEVPSGGFALLWIASVLVPLLILVVAAAWSWTGTEEDARIRALRTVDMLHEHALRSFETQEAILEAIDQRLEGMEWDEIARSRDVHEFLAALDRRSLPSGGIVLVAPDKQIVAGSARYPFEPIDASDREYTVDHAHDEAGTLIGQTVISRPRGTRVFPISRPRRLGATGSGWIVASFRPGYFEEFYRSVAEHERDLVSLMRSDGVVLADTNVPEGEIVGLSGESFVTAVRNSPISGIIPNQRGEDGVDRMLAYRVLSGYPLYVVYGLNRDVIVAAWLRDVAAYAAICLLAALLLLALTSRVQRAVRRERVALAETRVEMERRAEAESRLLHAQRVDALGRVVGGVAHDFNNIVQAMKGGAARVSRRADDPDEVRRVAALIDSTAARGARLIARMLAFARREQGRTQRFKPGGALREIGEFLDETIGSGYRVALDIAEPLPAIEADHAEFETVIVNLVLNARDAMPGGGTITVTAQTDIPAAEDTEPSSAQAGPYLTVTVSDTGEGMDEETLARAGEPFFTTKPPGKGTGLGLATARAFCEQAGGYLSIESARARGTSVSLRLPIDVDLQA